MPKSLEQFTKHQRYSNKKLKSVYNTLYLRDVYLCEASDQQKAPKEHLYGPYIEFDSKGQVKKIAVFNYPMAESVNNVFGEASTSHVSSLKWSATFTPSGELKEVIGTPSAFEPTKEMIVILKNEHLIDAANKAFTKATQAKKLATHTLMNTHLRDRKGKEL